ncbi:MAG: ABC transporter ATP-binding protein [Alphaproteobacteria bacterium]|nr:ABC transporter ATP-binding protein [Alphaproteobacteria bacterium]
MNAIGAPVIEAKTVGKTYGVGRAPVRALDGVSFAVPEAAFVSLVGPSGCGKSTLLQIMGGLVPSTEGEVLIDRERVAKPMPGKIAIVFQDATLLPWKTARANVEFPLELQGIGAAERRRRSDDMLNLVGLGDFTERFPHELSGGMKQRVSIARGLAQEPRIILMDEPFGALDEQTRIKMGQELLRIWEATRKTIFLITHSLTEAIYLSDRVLVMSHRPGRIVETLTIDLPRPRTYDMIGGVEFGRARNRIWSLITADEAEGAVEP